MQSAKLKIKKEISERILNFAATIIKLYSIFIKKSAGRHMWNQLMRASTSVGANYEEACGAESKQDFIHKMQLVLKELRESLYWLKLSVKSDIFAGNASKTLINESEELIRIIAKSVVTAKGR